MTVLIDTSFLVALAVTSDKNHRVATKSLTHLDATMVIPIPVMPEMFYMISTRMGYLAAVKMYEFIQNETFQLEPLLPIDRVRMGEIMNQYLDAEFDFVDLAIMAIAERLKITQVCTFDHRDFSVFRPKHCTHYELLP